MFLGGLVLLGVTEMGALLSDSSELLHGSAAHARPRAGQDAAAAEEEVARWPGARRVQTLRRMSIYGARSEQDFLRVEVPAGQEGRLAM